MTDNAYRRSAFKPHPEGGIVACDWEDEAATRFQVGWVGSGFSSTSIDFDKRYTADWVCLAINDVFAAGKRRAMADLRQFLGIR